LCFQKQEDAYENGDEDEEDDNGGGDEVDDEEEMEGMQPVAGRLEIRVVDRPSGDRQPAAPSPSPAPTRVSSSSPSSTPSGYVRRQPAPPAVATPAKPAVEGRTNAAPSPNRQPPTSRQTEAVRGKANKRANEGFCEFRSSGGLDETYIFYDDFS